MLKLAFILGGAAVAALGGLGWAFSFGQQSVTYTLHLTVQDASGQPLAGQPVQVWRRDYPTHSLQLDGRGQLSLLLTESFGASVLTGPRRPATFPVQLQLPSLSPLYYSFTVSRTGPLGAYQVFNDSYSHNYTQWVGDFDAAGPVRRHLPSDQAGYHTPAVAPAGGAVASWQGTATLHRVPDHPDGRRHYELTLLLQQRPAVPVGTP